MDSSRIEDILSDISTQLDKCVQFWLDHSIDSEHGGYYNCLTRDGQVYDDTKYGWLQGRQVWMLATLYRNVDRFKTPRVLQAAHHGADFLNKYIRAHEDKYRCYFAVNKQGEPLKCQRTIFTESFYIIAMAAMFGVTGNHEFLERAVEMTDEMLIRAFEHPERLGIVKLVESPTTIAQPLNVPLIIMGTLEELYKVEVKLWDKYNSMSKRCYDMMLQHRKKVDNKNYILENIDQHGEIMTGSQGYLSCPGHAIEAGWFLVEYSKRANDSQMLNQILSDFISNPMSYGWDTVHGGLFYFLDARGAQISPTQLEWSMKLWWPHNEAMIALLMAINEVSDEVDRCRYWGKFLEVYDYANKHLVDKEFGEWYGYLDREGRPTSEAKGAPFKGFFHVPRCLMLCEGLLRKLCNEIDNSGHK